MSVVDKLDMRPTRCSQVTKHLPDGYELVRNNDSESFYFWGPDTALWPVSGVETYSIGHLTIRQWLAEFNTLRAKYNESKKDEKMDINLNEAIKAITEKTGLSSSEALYAFVAWLSGRKESVTFSSGSNCAIAADLVDAFCKANELEDPTDKGLKGWEPPVEESKMKESEFDTEQMGYSVIGDEVQHIKMGRAKGIKYFTNKGFLPARNKNYMVKGNVYVHYNSIDKTWHIETESAEEGKTEDNLAKLKETIKTRLKEKITKKKTKPITRDSVVKGIEKDIADMMADSLLQGLDIDAVLQLREEVLDEIVKEIKLKGVELQEGGFDQAAADKATELVKDLPTQAPADEGQVNKYLPKGYELVRGDGFYHFVGGDTSSWPDSSVKASKLNEFSIKGWVWQFYYLKTVNE